MGCITVKLSALLLLGFGLTGLQAQENVIATGGNASSSVGTVNFSVGQVVYTTITGTNGSSAQGVQQPYEISIVTSVEYSEDINLSVTAYPNPTTHHLTLEVKKDELSNFSFQLYDLEGKLLQSEKITSNKTNIDVNNLLPESYILKVTHDNYEIKVFKIIKK